jgi:hypothetical protein
MLRSRVMPLRFLAAVGVCLLLPRPAPAQDNDLAAAVKATYLYKFAAFIRWPSPAAEFPGDVFPLCVVGTEDGFADVLEQAVHGQTIEGRPIVARSLSSSAAASGCAVLYAAGAGPTAQAAIGAVHDKPVLTVTNSPNDSGPKGIINFVIRDNRVRFEIDEAAAAAAGLSISSKLLALAVSLRASSR